MEKSMQVEGMRCMHCKASVEKALNAVPGVTAAEADLEAKTVLIRMETNVEDHVLMDAVKAKGFVPVRIL